MSHLLKFDVKAKTMSTLTVAQVIEHILHVLLENRQCLRMSIRYDILRNKILPQVLSALTDCDNFQTCPRFQYHPERLSSQQEEIRPLCEGVDQMTPNDTHEVHEQNMNCVHDKSNPHHGCSSFVIVYLNKSQRAFWPV